MTPERYKEVGQLYRAALELEPARRAAYLAEVCSGDEALRQDVESLLGYAAHGGELLDQPALEVVAKSLAEEQSDSPVGRQLGSYQVQALLGAGGMGAVYRAQDTRLDRPVALKLLPAEVAADAERMRRFMREAKAASALNHPNVAHIYEIGEAEGASYIAMEYVEGQTLAAKINGQPLDANEIVEIGSQIADALDAAHSKGITHRDIKPQNIMLNERGQVKVLDFGLAKMTRPTQAVASDVSTLAKTSPGMVMGTIPYMSPEQALGREVDQRSDIFSLGVVLYEMATGRRPFVGASANGTLDKILHAEPEAIARINQNAPAELERIVRQCLEKKRAQRYQSAHDLLTDLRKLQRGRPTGARTTAGGSREVKPQWRTKRQWLTVTALAVIALATLVYVWLAQRARATLQPEIKSLAVLPLKNIGGDTQDEYLSDGITDELITKLTKLKSVRVISRSVAMRFKNSAKDAAEIGRELGVEAVLDGTLRKAGSRFRVSIHLVNAKDGFEMWADDGFEQDLRDLLDAQRQLAEAVAAKLKWHLTAQERALVAKNNTANVDAYEMLLRGKEHYAKSGSASQPIGNARELELARQMFERAIQLDSNYADAYAWLALILYSQFHDGYASRAALDAGVNYANRALAIDPDQLAARRALIYIYHSTGQAEAGLEQGRRALETSPNDLDAVEAAALAYFRAGILEKAISLYQKALNADPTDALIRNELARCYLYMGENQKGIDVLSPVMAQNPGGEWLASLFYMRLGQFDKAIEMGKRCLEEAPTSAGTYFVLGRAYKWAGQIERARATWIAGTQRLEAKVAAVENERTRIQLGQFYADLGEREKALHQVQQALADNPNDPWVLYETCYVHSQLGNRREAVDYLKRAVAQGFLSIHYVINDSRSDEALYNLRDDPEFRAVRRALEKKVEALKKQY